jgi:hypothetical protein
MDARAIDWASADVHEGEVTVELTGKASKAWREHFAAVVRLLSPGSSAWGEVKLVKRAVVVEAVRPGVEDELRHFLESVVVQVNAEVAPDRRAGAAGGRHRSAGGRRPRDRRAVARVRR